MDAIEVEILSQKLAAVLEEASWTIVRTSHSTAVREAWDFGCLLYGAKGELLCQNTTVASKIGVWHSIIPLILNSGQEIRDGDVFITNDPATAEAHLYDIAILKPVFVTQKLVAFVECIAHVAEIGGSQRNQVDDMYEEGIQIPVIRIMRNDEPVDEVWALLRANVRLPEQVLGDISAMIACARNASTALLGVISEYGLPDLVEIGSEIIDRTARAMRRAIVELIPPGRYEGRVEGDRVTLAVTLTVSPEGDILADYAGSSEQSTNPINCYLNHAYAWTVYTIKTLVNPEIPNNVGSFGAIKAIAPEGSIVNPRFPAPVRNRASVAHFIAPTVHSALSSLELPGLLAESGSPLWIERIFGTRDNGRRFAEILMINGGMGARPSKDGLSAITYPSNGGGTSIEVLESVVPFQFLEKSYRPNSGGAGKYRGGLGQRVSWRVVGENTRVRLLSVHERTTNAARGRRGGAPGLAGRASINGHPFAADGTSELKNGDVILLELPGGGGYGDPAERDAGLMEADLRHGLAIAAGAQGA